MKNNGWFIAVIFSTLTVWGLVLFALVCFQGIQINGLENQIAEVQTQNYELTLKLEETEQKCQRMTDTCIDVLSNKRWE